MRNPQMPLLEFYLYPPKYLSSAAIATLIPPASRQAGEAELHHAPKPDLTSEKNVLQYVNANQHTFEGGPALVAPASAI